MDNTTYELEDVFGDPEPKTVDWVRDAFELWHLIAAYLKIALSFAAIGACLFLIVIVLKYKKLRTRLNIYFVHYAILTIIFTMFTPSLYLIRILSDHFGYGITTMGYKMELCAFVTSHIFLTLAMVDWYLTYVHGNWVARHVTLWKCLTIYCVYLSTISTYVTIFVYYGTFIAYRRLLLAIPYFVLLVFVLVLRFLIFRQKPGNKDRYVVTIVTFVLLSWLPLVLFHYCFHIVYHSMFLRVMLVFLEDLPELYRTIIPIIVVVLLGRLNKEFGIIYNCIFKRSVANNGEADLDEVEVE